MVPQAANPQALNRYSYCLGRPLVGGDPTGHQGPVPGVGTLPWQSGLSLPPISPDVVQALSIAGPYVAPVVIAGGTVVVAGVGSYYVTTWAIQDNGPNYDVPLEFDPGTVNATYTLPGFSTLTAPTAGISPQVYARPVPKGNRGGAWGRNSNLDRTYNPDPRQNPPRIPPGGWRNFPFDPKNPKHWGIVIGYIGAMLFYAGYCESPTQQPGILEVVEPTPSPTLPSLPMIPSMDKAVLSTYPQAGPGRIPVEPW